MLLNDVKDSVLALKQESWVKKAQAMLERLEKERAESDASPHWTESLLSTSKLLSQAHSLIAHYEERINELEHLCLTDELTGIMNRRGFMDGFEREIDRVERSLSQGGLLVMIDIDNFKMINDNYGHESGNAALRVVASTLATDTRMMDIVARMGGDEFVLLFVNTTRKDALERAQFLIKKLNNLSFIWNCEEINVRASLGLKEYRKGSKIENIFIAADTDMYKNKKQLKQLGIRKQNKRMV